MEKQELVEKINSALAEEFEIDVEDITPDADIKKTLELDSLSLVDMVAIVEEVSGVKIKGSDVSQIKTFGALYDYLEQHC